MNEMTSGSTSRSCHRRIDVVEVKTARQGTSPSYHTHSTIPSLRSLPTGSQSSRRSHRHSNYKRDSSSSSRPLTTLRFASFAVLILLAIVSGSAAAALDGAHVDRRYRFTVSAGRAQFGHLLVDRDIPTLIRKDSDDDDAETTAAPSRTVAPTETPQPSPTDDAEEPTLTKLPMPFDTSLGNNFTVQSCPDFFISFLNDATFQACSPLSLLLYTSASFFNAQKSNVLITQTLDATCNVGYEQCSALMDSYAQQLRTDAACGADLRLGNPSVTTALDGMIAYQPLYAAGCMKDDDGNYCFANAATNETSNEDSYIYYLALGTKLPGGSRPTCNSCLKDTMAVFNVAAGNTTQPISKTYPEAAGQINLECGPSYVNATVSPIGAATSLVRGGISPLFVACITLAAFFV